MTRRTPLNFWCTGYRSSLSEKDGRLITPSANDLEAKAPIRYGPSCYHAGTITVAPAPFLTRAEREATQHRGCARGKRAMIESRWNCRRGILSPSGEASVVLGNHSRL
jgi:hypothetical protein